MINMTTALIVACMTAGEATEQPIVVPAQDSTSKPLRRMACGPYEQWCARKWTTRDGLPDAQVDRISLDAQGRVLCRTSKGAAVLADDRWSALSDAPAFADRPAIPNDLPGTLPWLPATCAARSSTGQLWVGTARGLCRWDGKRWQVFHSGAWLPNNAVIDVALTADGSAWVATRAGVAHIYTKPMTLARKADLFENEIRRYHNWRGLIKEIGLPAPGQLEGYTQPSSDNDGLWTSLYVAAESFRYAATRDPNAKANATESMKAMLFLEEVTSLPGFVARSYTLPGKGPAHGGVWYRSKDGKWDWKADTSSDEIDGHFWAYGIYYDLVDDEPTRRQVVETARRLMDRIIKDGFYLCGPDGKHTSWGVWAPKDLNENPKWFFERGLNSLELLSYLKVAEHVTGDDKYLKTARELIDKHGYARNTINQKIVIAGEVNHSDDELAAVCYYNLVRLEKDPELRSIYMKSLERTQKVLWSERSPFHNFIYGSAATGGFDLAECVAWFQDVPLDTIRWTVDNSGRRDVRVAAQFSRFRKPQTTTALPISERAVMRWNSSPFDVREGGGGHSKLDGTFWLLPYWMGRYYGFIVE
jgi:hypothetical protein